MLSIRFHGTFSKKSKNPNKLISAYAHQTSRECFCPTAKQEWAKTSKSNNPSMHSTLLLRNPSLPKTIPAIYNEPFNSGKINNKHQSQHEIHYKTWQNWSPPEIWQNLKTVSEFHTKRMERASLLLSEH